MAKGFLIAQVTVTNPEASSRYAKAAGDLLRHYGARIIVKPESALIKEGSPKARTVIFEFESFDKAKEFWDSREYVEARVLRAGAAEADFILIEGAD
ncbi:MULTISPECIES: DUF1330 domain-containing protein [unclassified Rhizobium]|uniref:DUF1330 domain-containing protein n=1 Tax=unclassified Rhizobium TaxID=2613769 RepID=UPI00247966D6|nr:MULTISPECIES: DUF1330 domain-containing protein [unclassified Rhizobium]MDH7804575.1 uncharacterized protein (DUF1330 family) [Rhizobium sp. AN70]